jgi:transcription antitermination protein NusB
MGARHDGRQTALQILYQLDSKVAPEAGAAEQASELFLRHFEASAEGISYAKEACLGVSQVRVTLDQLIENASDHWRLERMSRIDRNILRLGTWELLHQKEIPRAVIIDEAVILGQLFGAETSSAFVNGVLNRIAENLGRHDTDKP